MNSEERFLKALRVLRADTSKQNRMIITIIAVMVFITSLIDYKLYTYIETKDIAINKKIDDSMDMYAISRKNEDALSGFVCAQCHTKMGMYLPKTSGLSYEAFSGYVRGSDRFAKNTMMPKFTQEDISDEELMRIWKKLY
jgi:hypothetical protein